MICLVEKPVVLDADMPVACLSYGDHADLLSCSYIDGSWVGAAGRWGEEGFYVFYGLREAVGGERVQEDAAVALALDAGV